MGEIIKSKRYANTVWCFCGSYSEYRQFVKDLYLYNIKDSHFGGEQFKLNYEWFGEDKKSDWMDVFGIAYIKEEDGDILCECEIEDPLHDDYEITEKPRENEYPVVVFYNLELNILDWCSYAIDILLQNKVVKKR